MARAQAISLNVIIVAVIGMLVLVVLAAVFAGRIGIFVREVGACKGSCVDSEADCRAISPDARLAAGDCPGPDGKLRTEDDQLCCIAVVPS